MDAQPLTVWQGRPAEEWRREWGTGELRFFEQVGSTNDVVAEMAAAGAPQLSIAVAEVQTRGRGRAGASWRAEPGKALLFSVLFRAERPGGSPGCAPVRVGLAVADAISASCGHDALVKWPNDVVFPGAGKVAGVLCEGAFAAEGQSYIVAGIGINVSQAAEEFDADLRDSACSIASATGMLLDRAALLGGIVSRLHGFAGHVTEALTASELSHYRARDILLDAEVVCDLSGKRLVRGTARGVADDGALLIEQPTGLLPIYNATVRLARTPAYPGSVRDS